MSATVIAGLVRHLLTGVAGGFAMKYGIDGAAVDAIVSGFAALAGAGWSIYDKRSRV